MHYPAVRSRRTQTAGPSLNTTHPTLDRMGASSLTHLSNGGIVSRMNHRDRLTAQVAVIAIGVASLLTQVVVLPWAASSLAKTYPLVAHLKIPYLATLIVAIFLFETALLAAWVILKTPGPERAQGEERTAWSAILITSLSLSFITAGLCFGHASFVEKIGGPPVLFGFLLFLGAGVSVAGGRKAIQRTLFRQVLET